MASTATREPPVRCNLPHEPCPRTPPARLHGARVARRMAMGRRGQGGGLAPRPALRPAGGGAMTWSDAGAFNEAMRTSLPYPGADAPRPRGTNGYQADAKAREAP